jgi:hypothetical protein
MGLGVFVVVEPAVRGLDILLANDCELPDAWSSVGNFDRCELRVPEPLAVPRPVSLSLSRVAVVRGVPCEVVPGDLPLTLLDAVSRAEALGTDFRPPEAP